MAPDHSSHLNDASSIIFMLTFHLTEGPDLLITFQHRAVSTDCDLTDQKRHKRSIWWSQSICLITSNRSSNHICKDQTQCFFFSSVTHVHKNEQQQTESPREYLNDAEATSSGASFFTQLANQLGFHLNYLPWELKKAAAKNDNVKLLDWKQLHLGNFCIWK